MFDIDHLLHYHFTDTIGHELEFCQEYIDMIQALNDAKDLFNFMFVFGSFFNGGTNATNELNVKLMNLGNALKKLNWLPREEIL